LTFDFGVKVTKLYLFKSAILVYYSVQFLEKSTKPFKIYHKMKYLTFEFDLWNNKLGLYSIIIVHANAELDIDFIRQQVNLRTNVIETEKQTLKIW